jgi:cytochrome c553
MKRKILVGIAATLIVSAIALGLVFGPELWAYDQFGRTLERQQTTRQADGGAWPQLQDSCSLCHGMKGQPSNAQYASLAGLSASYIEAQLFAFATDRRRNPFMAPYAASLREDQITVLAAYYARQEPARNESAGTVPALARQGEAAVAAGACASCHGDKLMGSEIAPRLAGQGELYLVDQLEAFKRGERQDPTKAMDAVARTLSEEKIKATAHYLASLTPG